MVDRAVGRSPVDPEASEPGPPEEASEPGPPDRRERAGARHPDVHRRHRARLDAHLGELRVVADDGERARMYQRPAAAAPDQGAYSGGGPESSVPNCWLLLIPSFRSFEWS